MNALQVISPRSIGRIQVPIPQLPHDRKGTILVRNAWALTCGSDIPFFSGNKRFQSYPLAPGAPVHECTGEVVESTSKEFCPGSRVLAIPDGNQGLAEYFLAQANKTVALTPDMDDLGAACLIQPLSTVMSALERLRDLQGKSLVVIGLGSIGLLFCWLAKRAGASSVLGIDPFANRCRMAETLGATRTICRRSIELVHETRVVPAEWNPPDICIEAVGHQMATLNDCLELVRKCGTIVAFGVPDQPVYALEFEVFFRKNALLIASVTPDWEEYLPKARDLFLANRHELSKLITHRLPMADTEKAFSLYERHEDGIIKAALDASRW